MSGPGKYLTVVVALALNVALTVALLTAVAAPAKAGDLVVRIGELRSADGEVRLALYDDAGRFLQQGGARRGVDVRATEAGVEIVLSGLTPGAYAIATYHDENDNGAFDTGFLGLPLEGFGFSNDASVLLGAPSFGDVAGPVPAAGAAITVRMRYWDGVGSTASASNTNTRPTID